jgi:hypothetical protein
VISRVSWIIGIGLGATTVLTALIHFIPMKL